MNIEAGTSYTDPAFYKRTVFECRVFQKRHYLWPIPQSKMDRNTILYRIPIGSWVVKGPDHGVYDTGPFLLFIFLCCAQHAYLFHYEVIVSCA